jgi:diguanylate cyclase (GGDEF)-like protein
VVSAALAERRQATVRVGPKSAEDYLRLIAGKLQIHAESLDRLNAQLDRRVAERDARLEIVRAALDQEIKKRLWAEQELTQSNHHLKDQAMHDGLTGLYNRRYLEESLAREESRARRSGRSLGILMIDIDEFKRFNDTLGHAAGDAVLRAMGQYLLMAARGEDIVCRYGGEEFVLVMSQAPHNTVLQRAENLRQGVQQLGIEYEGRLVGPITVSIGIGIFPDHGNSVEGVLRAADAAMYEAKQLGRNRVTVGGYKPTAERSAPAVR